MAQRADRRRISQSRVGTLLYSRRWAKVTERTLLALGRARDADLSAMLDQEVREQGPLIARKERHQILLDLHGIGVRREGETLADARDVRVDDDTLVAIEGVAENDVRCLAAHTRQIDELLHLGWNDAAVFFGNGVRHPDETPRLVTEEPSALDHLLELL